MCGKFIVIEGTDCSGKATQTNLLVESLKKEGYKVGTISYPVYSSPTGKIIGACLLGKENMCKTLLKQKTGFFPEGGSKIDEKVACDLYAADRRYNIKTLLELLKSNDIVIADRYVYSNMAHRGGLKKSKEERYKIYNFVEILEYELNELPKPDDVYLLYMPFEYGEELRKQRNNIEILDEAEKDIEYLKNSEEAYLELAKLYNFQIINCIKNGKVRKIDDISKELVHKVKKRILK